MKQIKDEGEHTWHCEGRASFCRHWRGS